MKSEVESKSYHPNGKTLALYSAGDLPWSEQRRVRQHARGCLQCEREVENFRSAASALRQEAHAETLTGFEAIADWRRLEREMLGNIAVGVSAARCIDRVGRGWWRNWRGAMVGTGLAVVFVGGWFMNIPKEQGDHLSSSIRRLMGMEPPQFDGTVVRSTPDGIAVRTQGATLTLMHPGQATIGMAGSSSVGARYVDADSGQVTITNVYGQ